MNRRNLSIFSFNKNIVFLGKIILFLCIIILYINKSILPQYYGEYTSSLIDKAARLTSIDGPKIVLLGDSNLAFGINSSLIEEELGMPVVNMGLHGGAGNVFHEEMAKFNIQEGDIYIICHSNYDDENTVGEIYAWISVENHYHLWKLIRPVDIIPMIKSFPWYLKNCLNLYSSGTGNQEPDGVYSKKAFNKYGDIALLRSGSNYEFQSPVKPSLISEATVNRINELSAYLHARGATLLVAGYPIGNGKLTSDADEFIEFQQNLEAQLDCAVISNYADYMFDYSYFYNTDLHLFTEGANIRTWQLISDIERWQQTGTDAAMSTDAYQNITADVNLSHITNMDQYLLSLLDGKERYTIFMSIKESSMTNHHKKIYQNMHQLGLNAFINGALGGSYLAVIDKENVYEQSDFRLIEASGAIDEGNICYTLQSGGRDFGNVSSICLNKQEYSMNQQGLNIVVYSNESHRILDKVSFDIDCKAIR